MDQTFDIDQARLAAKVGAITAAHVRAVNGNQWAVVFATPAGTPELVTTRQREPRRFRDAALALKALREIGVLTAVVEMEGWDTAAGKPPAWSRPEQSAKMKARHQRAAADAELEEKVREAIAKAPGSEWMANSDLVAVLVAKVAQIDDFDLHAAIEAALKAGPPPRLQGEPVGDDL